MSGRIWPGALCVWVAPGMNCGRIVTAERLCVDGEEFDSICGSVKAIAYNGGAMCWVVSCSTPLSWTEDDGIRHFYMKRSATERLLRPITPPPGASFTDDREPIDAPMTAG